MCPSFSAHEFLGCVPLFLCRACSAHGTYLPQMVLQETERQNGRERNVGHTFHRDCAQSPQTGALVVDVRVFGRRLPTNERPRTGSARTLIGSQSSGFPSFPVASVSDLGKGPFFENGRVVKHHCIRVEQPP